jgi:hypothetical protein
MQNAPSSVIHSWFGFRCKILAFHVYAWTYPVRLETAHTIKYEVDVSKRAKKRVALLGRTRSPRRSASATRLTVFRA